MVAIGFVMIAAAFWAFTVTGHKSDNAVRAQPPTIFSEVLATPICIICILVGLGGLAMIFVGFSH